VKNPDPEEQFDLTLELSSPHVECCLRFKGTSQRFPEPFEALKEKCLVSLCLWSQKRVDKQPWLQAPLERVGAREALKLSHLSDDQLENSRSPAPRDEVNMGQKSCHLPNPIMNGHLSTI